MAQVVTIITYVYIVLAIVAQQDADPPNADEPSFYFPVFTLIDTIVYLGALRVGQLYVNPLGSDDDDYGINRCIYP